jgi:hypothetical protein
MPYTKSPVTRDDAVAAFDRAAALFREAGDRCGGAVTIINGDAYRIESDALEFRSHGREDLERALAVFVGLRASEEATARTVLANLGT